MDNTDDRLFFSVKVGKSYKNRGWALSRESAVSLIPKISYEDECDVIIDGIPAKARLNIVPRIFYNKNPDIVNHLKKLSNDNVERVDLELLLNHDDCFYDFETKKLLTQVNNVNYELQNKNTKLCLLKDEITCLQSFKRNNNEELVKLHNEIDNLKNIISNQDNEIKNLFNLIVKLEEDNEESFKKIKYYEDENKSLNRKLEKLLEVINE